MSKTKKSWSAFPKPAPNHAAGALREIMRELGPINKDHEVIIKGKKAYNYRGIEDVMNAFHGLLAEHGLVCIPKLTSEPVFTLTDSPYQPCHITAVYEFHLQSMVDESVVVLGPVVGEGYDNQDKAANKALSNAMKYALFTSFCIATGELRDSEADDQGDSGGYVAPIQPRSAAASSRPVDKADDDKDARHRDELLGIVMKLGEGDVGKAKEMLKKFSSFTSTIAASKGEVIFIDSFKNPQFPDDKDKWNPKLKGKWLNTTLSKARNAYDKWFDDNPEKLEEMGKELESDTEGISEEEQEQINDMVGKAEESMFDK